MPKIQLSVSGTLQINGTVSANDVFRPVSRYFDRITRPEQIMPALRRAMATTGYTEVKEFQRVEVVVAAD